MFLALPPYSKYNTKALYGNVFDSLHCVAKSIGLKRQAPYSGLNLIRSRSIGLMLPNLSNAFYTDILRAIESVAVKSGFSLFVCPTYQSAEKETNLLEDLLERKTGGLIVISNSAIMAKDFKKAYTSMRIVSIQSDIKGIDSITVTDEQGMFESAEHLLKLGHTRIAFIGYNSSMSSLSNRLAGFKAALKKHNVPADESLIFREHLSSSGYITAKTLLSSRNPPTAIQCINDHLAMGVYMAASELSIKIPQDISVSGFDNSIMSRIMTPALTTVAQPTAEMGETAAQLIIKRIIGDDRTEPRNIVLPTKHIIRDSTATAYK
jgi:LacI family transcriptional regulator